MVNCYFASYLTESVLNLFQGNFLRSSSKSFRKDHRSLLEYFLLWSCFIFRDKLFRIVYLSRWFRCFSQIIWIRNVVPIRSYIYMLLMPLYIWSVSVQEASQFSIVLVLHALSYFPVFVKILQAKSGLLSIPLYFLLKS